MWCPELDREAPVHARDTARVAAYLTSVRRTRIIDAPRRFEHLEIDDAAVTLETHGTAMERTIVAHLQRAVSLAGSLVEEEP
jgi:hypothetical protein